ncbi:MAG: hypothetical protein ACKVY0_01165 [Prosthecobacter sp.]|uniref:hypothetical protein n=1 Tax=Prosthecobacter sp. TaxID=1965333 RepID=UPI003900411D
MFQTLSHDVQLLLIGLTVLSGLFLIAMIRTFVLLRDNDRMHSECTKMEKQALEQQIELTAIHHDAMSWRAKTQRQFDALRGDLSHRLLQSEQSNQHAQQGLDVAQSQSLTAMLAKITELEARLAAKPAPAAPSKPPAPAFAKPAESSLPSLPAMETLRLQSLEAELAATKAELTAHRQQNAALQRTLLLARRRQPALRKSGTRGMARNN